MANKNQLQFRQILAWLMVEVMFGRCHYAIVRGLSRGVPEFDSGRASYRQTDELFERTGEILNKLSLLYHGKAAPLHLEGANDYEQVINLLAQR